MELERSVRSEETGGKSKKKNLHLDEWPWPQTCYYFILNGRKQVCSVKKKTKNLGIWQCLKKNLAEIVIWIIYLETVNHENGDLPDVDFHFNFKDFIRELSKFDKRIKSISAEKKSIKNLYEVLGKGNLVHNYIVWLWIVALARQWHKPVGHFQLRLTMKIINGLCIFIITFD